MISSPILRATLISVLVTGLVSSSVQGFSLEVPSVSANQKIGIAAATFVFAGLSSYLALTQDDQPKLTHGNPIALLNNWYRRVICGKASKKSQEWQPNGEIKDVYSKSSGLFGKAISFYDANEKDVKKAIGIAAIPAAGIMGWITLTGIKDLMTAHLGKAPYGEFAAVVKIATETAKK